VPPQHVRNVVDGIEAFKVILCARQNPAEALLSDFLPPAAFNSALPPAIALAVEVRFVPDPRFGFPSPRREHQIKNPVDFDQHQARAAPCAKYLAPEPPDSNLSGEAHRRCVQLQIIREGMAFPDVRGTQRRSGVARGNIEFDIAQPNGSMKQQNALQYAGQRAPLVVGQFVHDLSSARYLSWLPQRRISIVPGFQADRQVWSCGVDHRE
jgi:hypothetical protein